MTRDVRRLNVSESLLTVSDDVAAAAAALAQDGRAILGVAGAPGSGKTTFAELLVERVCSARGAGWAAHLPMDGFHLGDRSLTRLGLLDRKGAPDTFDADGYAAALQRVRTATGPVFVPGFDRGLEQPIAADMVVPAAARLVVTEGNYLLLDEPRWLAARAQLAQVWCVEGSEDLRLQRLIARHIQFGKSPSAAASWVASVDGPNAALIAATADSADRVVRNDGAVFGW